MNSNSKKFGDEGEKIAVELLQSKGYQIVKQNYRYGKGEIDIIAKIPGSEKLIFVEVKSRKNLEFGSPEYAVTKGKIKQLRKVASSYLYEMELGEADCRFDVITILFRGKLSPIINHIENAFQ